MEYFIRGGIQFNTLKTYRIVNLENNRVFRAKQYEYNTYTGDYENTYLKIGGRQSDCVEIVYNKYNKTGVLQWVDKTDNDCEITKPEIIKLNNGHVNMIELVKVALTFLYKINGDENINLVLNDSSTISCAKDKDISLRHYYFFKYSKTWYELHFEAVPSNTNYNRFKEKFDKPIIRYRDDYIVFMKNIYGNTITRLFDESNTYRDFVDKLNEHTNQLENNEKCKYYTAWIQDFVSRHFGDIPQNWNIIINREMINTHYELMPIKGGKKSKKHSVMSFKRFTHLRYLYKTQKNLIKARMVV